MAKAELLLLHSVCVCFVVDGVGVGGWWYAGSINILLRDIGIQLKFSNWRNRFTTNTSKHKKHSDYVVLGSITAYITAEMLYHTMLLHIPPLP